MAAIDRGLETLNFLPDGVREALRRRLRELGGFGLIVLATLLALALATWSVQDPSLSHATNAPVRNLLGAPGAIVADLLMQVLGVAALAFILPIAIWGWRLVTHRPLRNERLRLLFWLLGVVLCAGCVAAQSKLSAELEDEDDNAARVASRKPRATARAPRKSSGGYVLPSLELLAAPKAIGRATLSADALQANATALEGVLADFGVRGEIINARP